MTEIHTTTLVCDRCQHAFDHKGQTMQIGWFRLANGSGSKATTPRGELDKDLCSSCTTDFNIFMGALKGTQS